ncbi:tail fiber domain-containing protein [Candidatus Woesearchaeota archaeon]|nr:tail fiber domain-containing protein [Candidatus Woesearchaeota archaeon]
MKKTILFGLILMMAVFVIADTICEDGNLNVPGNLDVDSGTLYVDSIYNQIGIGTTTPFYKTKIYGKGYASTSFNTSIGYNNTLNIQDSQGASYSGGMLLFGAGADRFVGIKASYTNGANYGVGDLLFLTRSSTTDILLTPKMTIKSNGNIGIGTYYPNATLTIKTGGTTVADEWFVRSDRFRKTNIVEFTTNLLDRPFANVYTYNMKLNDSKFDNITHFGLMIDEAPKEIVQDGRIGTYAFSSYNYKLIKELAEQNKKLNEHLSELSNINNLLTDELCQRDETFSFCKRGINGNCRYE